jgi:hypothetical protein
MRRNIIMIGRSSMLIKIQHHRMSRDWTIFENARNVKYSDQPVGFDTLESYLEYEKAFLKSRAGANGFVFKNADNKIVWNPGSSYFVNELSFLNEDGYLVNIIFDGEAFICNNEGKTVQRIHSGGFVRREPLPEAAY